MTAMPTPLLSVIICTYNRPESLPETLQSLHRQSLSPDQFEVIVVDNNSEPPTRQVVDEWSKNSPFMLHYVRETSVGLPYAKNAGIRASEADIVVFIDDDEIAHPGWAAGHLRGFNDDQNVSAVFGRNWLLWDAVPPGWLLRSRLMGDLAFIDWGNTTHRTTPSEHMTGGNTSYRKRVFDDLGLFDAEFPTSEDTEFEGRLRGAGHVIVYAHDALIFHHVPAERVTEKFFYGRAFRRGRHYVRMKRLLGNRPRRNLGGNDDGAYRGSFRWFGDRVKNIVAAISRTGLNPNARIPILIALSFTAGVAYETVRPKPRDD